MTRNKMKRDKRTLSQIAKNVVVQKKKEFDKKMDRKNQIIFYLSTTIFVLIMIIAKESLNN